MSVLESECHIFLPSDSDNDEYEEKSASHNLYNIHSDENNTKDQHSEIDADHEKARRLLAKPRPKAETDLYSLHLPECLNVKWSWDGKSLRQGYDTIIFSTDENGKAQSNANLVQWEDGTWSIAVGEKHYDCHFQPIKSFLLEDSNPEIYVVHNSINKKMTLKPSASVKLCSSKKRHDKGVRLTTPQQVQKAQLVRKYDSGMQSHFAMPKKQSNTLKIKELTMNDAFTLDEAFLETSPFALD